MKECVEYKGREYHTHDEVTEAYLNGELDNNEFDKLFDTVAIFVEGLEKSSPRQKHDYWGDPIAEDKTTIILIPTEGTER